MPVALAIRHEEIAHLGNLELVLLEFGYEIRYLDATVDSFEGRDADLVIVLGGDMGVYETEQHPFIEHELSFLERRLGQRQPTLGVCLGAQLMAAALGASVVKGASVEIGFRDVELTDAGTNSPVRHFAGVPVVQWHGDTFELPSGATRLAESRQYANEAYAVGDYALAVQFHPELQGAMYDEWIADGVTELDTLGIDPADLRAQRDKHAAAMEAASSAMLREWLSALALRD